MLQEIGVEATKFDSAVFNQFLEKRYSRKTVVVNIPDRKGRSHRQRFPMDEEAAHRPLWFKEIATTLSMVSELRVKERDRNNEEFHDVLKTIGCDKLDILCDPVRARSKRELEIFGRLNATIANFWPSTDKRGDTTMQGSIDLFLDEVEAWNKEGLPLEVVDEWVKSIAGFMVIDPLFSRQLMMSRTLSVRMESLAGLKVAELEGNDRDRAFRQKIERMQSHGFEILIPDSIVTTLEQINLFSVGLQEEIKNRISLGIYSGDKLEEMTKIMQSSQRLNILIDLMQIDNFQGLDLKRPEQYERILPQVAIALSEKLLSDEGPEASNEISDRIVSILRRRRVDVDDFLAFCKSFRIREGIDYQNANIVDLSRSKSLRCNGLYMISMMLGNVPDKMNLLRKISDEIIPNVVFRMRSRGLSTDALKWDEKDYGALGMGNLREAHDLALGALNSVSEATVEDIKPGSIVFEFSSQANLFHHEEMVRSMCRTRVAELVAAGIVEPGFSGDVVVLFNVNHGNPHKQPEVPHETRRNMVARVLRDLGYLKKLVVLPKEYFARVGTHVRLSINELRLKEIGRPSLVYGRFCGADEIDNPEYQDDEVGNPTTNIKTRPHVFSLQLDDIKNVQTILEKGRNIFDEFGKGVIVELLPQQADVHSSSILSGLNAYVISDGRQRLNPHRISKKAFLTLVPPVIAKECYRVWMPREDWNKFE